jgi:enoyl-CoA hydratase
MAASSLNALQTIIYEKRAQVAYVTLNRPSVMNALNHAAVEELTAAFEEIRADHGIRGVILMGAGEKAFIAGADIGELAKSTALDAVARTKAGQDLFNLIENLGKPVIAAVNGLALGGGCEAAMAATIRIASNNARFGQPEVKLGLIPGFGGTQRLPRLVGRGLALQLILTGDMISAEEALRIGLVNEIVEPSALVARAEEILSKILANAPQAVTSALEAVNLGQETTLANGLALESKLFALCTTTKDMREGTSAFLEKRAPNFTGE